MNVSEPRRPPPAVGPLFLALFFCAGSALFAGTITATPSPGTVNSAVQLTANISQPLVEDAEGNPVTPTSYTYSWQFGDGSSTTTSTNTASHTYTTSGTYTINCSLSGSAGLPDETSNSVPATPLSLTVQDSTSLTISAPGHVSEGESIAISATGVASDVTITVTPASGYSLVSGNLTGTGSVSATIKYVNAGTYSLSAAASGYSTATPSVGVHSYAASGTFAAYEETETLAVTSDSNQVSTTFTLTISDTSILVFGTNSTGTASTSLTLSSGSGSTTIYATGVGETSISIGPQ